MIEIPDRNPTLTHQEVAEAYEAITRDLEDPLAYLLQDTVGRYTVAVGAGLTNPDNLPMILISVHAADEGVQDCRQATLLGVAVDEAKDLILSTVAQIVEVLDAQDAIIAAAATRLGLEATMVRMLADMYDEEA